MMDDEQYGPALPPGFKQHSDSSDEAPQTSDSETTKNAFIGPQCPPEFLKNKHHAKDKKDKSDSSASESLSQNSEYHESDDESEVFGPMPASYNYAENHDDVIAAVEKRAKDMKRKLEGSSVPVPEKIKREEWMTTPNTSSRNQLGAISRCLASDGSSDSKSKKRSEKEHRRTSEKDKQLSNELEKYNKSKRSKSLLEMHQKSKKEKEKKAKESSKPKERKPFDRDAELSLRFMNKGQINSVIKKSKLLDSRFSRGSSHYL